MVVDIFFSDMPMINGHDDIIYLDKRTHRQPSIWHDVLSGLFHCQYSVVWLSTFTCRNSGQCYSRNSVNYCRKHLALGVPVALAVTTTFSCLENGLVLTVAIDQYPILFRLQAGTQLCWSPDWQSSVGLHWKIVIVISTVSPESNI